MDPVARYEILNQIAVGDFATVYRARDRELHREVAIKQIHPQFLADPRQLERFWNEAQLLASLQHPHIVTIYDLVRSHGWLILELMQGNLLQLTRGQPIDLDYLRVVLLCCLDALRFLHAHGVIHGDVKPSNMLVDAQRRVKLGDFGLARRASNKEGSLLKGTTKYMAPEMISNQFGPVGPASDLYSLGFAAYELMCGQQFDTLFPSLSTFGPNKQIAWLMWHAAVDLKPPPVASVLEGVPDDLAYVVERLTCKDQAKRFRSAEEVIACLQRPAAATTAAGQQVDTIAADQPQRRRRMLAVVAVICSLLVSLLMLLPGKQSEPPPAGPAKVVGIIRHVDPGDRILVVEDNQSGEPVEFPIKPRDEVLINDRQATLADLAVGDRASVEKLTDSQGRPLHRIHITRAETAQGMITALEPDEGKLTFVPEDQSEAILVHIDGDTQLALNGKHKLDDQPVKLGDLQPKDRVEVEFIRRDDGELSALAVRALRVVSSSGVVREVNASSRQLTVAVDGPSGPLLKLPWADDCAVILNGKPYLAGRLLKPSDLQPGDDVTIWHDTQIVRVEARRFFFVSGTVRAVHYEAGALQLQSAGGGEQRFLVGPSTKITLAGQPVGLEMLRPGDLADIAHKMPDADSPEAVSIAATRPADPHRWAILIGVENYDDASLTRIPYVSESVAQLRDVLVQLARVPQDHLLLLNDPSRVRFEQGISALLDRLGAEDQLTVYFAGHAYLDDNQEAYLAPKTFDYMRMDSSGIPLRWLVDRLESSPGKEKLLLLDCSHAGNGADLARQPSAAEVAQTLADPSGRWPFQSVTIIASSSPGQRGFALPGENISLFAKYLAEGYTGRADSNRDGRLESTELLAYLKQQLPRAAEQLQAQQTPQIFLPNVTPPRLSPEAKDAIRRLAAFMGQDEPQLDQAKVQFANASQLAGKEPEPKLIYAMLLMRNRQRDEAALLFEQLRIEQTSSLLPVQALAWMQFDKRSHDSGAQLLVELVSRIGKLLEQSDEIPPNVTALLQWAGRLRQFAQSADRPPYRAKDATLAKLDQAVDKLPPSAKKLFEQGRQYAQQLMADIDQKIDRVDNITAAKLRLQRRQVRTYAEFPYQQAVQTILAGMDK